MKFHPQYLHNNPVNWVAYFYFRKKLRHCKEKITLPSYISSRVFSFSNKSPIICLFEADVIVLSAQKIKIYRLKDSLHLTW